MAAPSDDVVALRSRAELAEACKGDLLTLWAAQDLALSVRAWTHGGAVAVATSQLSNRDRLVVSGSAHAAPRLVRAILPLVADTFRPLAPREVMTALASAIDEIEPVGEFAWMQTRMPLPPAGKAVVGVEWLGPETFRAVTELLSIAFPESNAKPGVPGVRRWAGVGDRGELLAVAAEAWSAPDVGFVSGVATHPAARGKGYGTAVCRFVFDALLETHGALGLFVDSHNEPAVRLYRSLGMDLVPVAAAKLVRPPGHAS